MFSRKRTDGRAVSSCPDAITEPELREGFALIDRALAITDAAVTEEVAAEVNSFRNERLHVPSMERVSRANSGCTAPNHRSASC